MTATHDLRALAAASLVGAWRAYATRADGAAMHELPGASAAVFPHGAAREIFNNALLSRGVADVDATLAALRRLDGEAGVGGFALWVDAADERALATGAAAGWRQEEATCSMAMRLPAEGLDAAAGAGEADGAGVEPLAEPAEAMVLNGAVPELLSDWPADARGYVARGEDGRALSTALALRIGDDCHVAFVATDPAARRRGLAGRVLARLLADAAADGCTTASLNATEIAESLYARAGFVALGRIVELVPPEGWQ
ncbi:MAG TPA: GNAT family N-acetyltransferase [Conexibacter sp.]|nr:GNAT family N-acetyltransferase [Conexibacter sp.]